MELRSGPLLWLVIAAVGACGRISSTDDEPSGGAATDATECTPMRPLEIRVFPDCASWAQVQCSDYEQLANPESTQEPHLRYAECYCDPTRPSSNADCVDGDFRCDFDLCAYQRAEAKLCGGDCTGIPSAIGCTCASSSVDCPRAQQVCDDYEPRQACTCDPTRPSSAEACNYSFQFLCEDTDSECECLDLEPAEGVCVVHEDRNARLYGLDVDCSLQCQGEGAEYDCACICVDRNPPDG